MGMTELRPTRTANERELSIESICSNKLFKQADLIKILSYYKQFSLILIMEPPTQYIVVEFWIYEKVLIQNF